MTLMQALKAGLHELPKPDAASLKHSEQVADHIRGVIRDNGGTIGFAEFMHNALYASGLGYYVAGASKFGAAGDFVTAPEVSPIFSRILARQAAGVLRQFDRAEDRNVLELGAGSGALAVAMLGKLEELDSLPERYFILDVSADLSERQAAKIKKNMPNYFERVVWLSAFPESFCGVVIANEVVDALPVERFSKSNNVIHRQSVTCSTEGFAWQSEPAPDVLCHAIESIENSLGCRLPDNYISEISLGVCEWVADLANRISRGFCFVFDYGVSQREYYAADRCDGWLRCHFRHHAHSDPLVYPGIQDLTAWVDFTRLAQAAFDNGLQVAGYVTQAQFLMHSGLQEELRIMDELPTAAQIELSRQVKVLTLPGEMGEHIKCLGLSKGQIESPRVFEIADRAHAL